MARTIDAAVQTALEADQATINVILEIFWAGGATTVTAFPAPSGSAETLR